MDYLQATLTTLSAVLAPESALLVAGPIHTGLEYFLARDRPATVWDGEYWAESNRSRLTTFAEALRKRRSQPVINPGLLQITPWHSADYKQFYRAVIAKFVQEVWFLDGWAASLGAVDEFVHSVQFRVQTLDERGVPMSREMGCALIADTIRSLSDIGIEQLEFNQALDALR